MRTQQKRLVGALEYMKGEVDDAINSYHEGVQNAVQCKLRLWAALRDTLLRLNDSAFVGVAWLRVEVPHDQMALANVAQVLGSAAVTLRYVGPREQDVPAVVYVTAKAKEVREVVDWIAALRRMNYGVRDFSYGCSRGG